MSLSQVKLDNIITDPQAGIYLVDKPKGEDSFHTVSVMRKMLNLKKVGFAGTLDPLASGLLIVATGRATRLLDYFHQFPKVYEAHILFGQESDTYDLEGKVKINHDAQEFSRQDLENILKTFLGKQSQTVPIYSAKKIKGEKLHHIARRGGEVELPQNKIEIFGLTIKDFKYPRLFLEITCSAGTYIRSLAHDLGKVMDTGALLADLRRTKIGHYQVSEAGELSKISIADLQQYRLDTKQIIDSLGLYRDR